MPYISLMSSWKSNDIQSIENMVDNLVLAYYINELGEAQSLSKSTLIHMLRKRMQQVMEKNDLQWNFEIIHRAHVRGSQLIIFYVYSLENPDYKKTSKTMVTMTFGGGTGERHRIKTVYITPNVTDVNQ